MSRAGSVGPILGSEAVAWRRLALPLRDGALAGEGIACSRSITHVPVGACGEQRSPFCFCLQAHAVAQGMVLVLPRALNSLATWPAADRRVGNDFCGCIHLTSMIRVQVRSRRGCAQDDLVASLSPDGSYNCASWSGVASSSTQAAHRSSAQRSIGGLEGGQMQELRRAYAKSGRASGRA